MKVNIIHLAMEIDFQISDHVVAMEKVAEQCIQQNALNTIVFKLKVILLIREHIEKSESTITHLAY